MTPQGFLFAVASAGIKAPGRPDMALIYSVAEASAAATFTTNRVKAAPVLLGMKRVKSGKARAVVVNSGSANACTGAPGMRDAEEVSRLAGDALDVPERLVYPSSTGVIGLRLPLEKMRPCVKEMALKLGSASLEDAARAIMTTDTFPKFLTKTVKVGGKEGAIAGIAKGAGMIAPNMATMLCFLMTDLAVEAGALRAALKEAVEHSFNRVTVDGDRSTNDTALVMANGLAGNPPIKRGSTHFKTFQKALNEVAYELSKMIARDGEGATKLVEVEVRGARTEAEAAKAALKVANSMLVKTALYGADPNWGRIMSSLGSADVAMKEEKVDIHIGGVKVASKGLSTGAEAAARRELEKKEIVVAVDLRVGRGRASVLTCDLTEEYVKINAKYTT